MVHAKMSWGRVAWHGAELGVACAFVYTLAFIAYAMVRATYDLLATPQIDAGWLNIALATWFALAVPALLLAALFAPVVALVGAVTALIVNALASARHAAQTGALVCAVIALALVAWLTLTGFTWSLAIIETWLFWLVLPLGFYIAAGGIGGWLLGRMKQGGA